MSVEKEPSSTRAKWAAAHPLLTGLLSGLGMALLGIAFSQPWPLIGMVSLGMAIAIWLGWREGGWAYRLETRDHDLKN